MKRCLLAALLVPATLVPVAHAAGPREGFWAAAGKYFFISFKVADGGSGKAVRDFTGLEYGLNCSSPRGGTTTAGNWLLGTMDVGPDGRYGISNYAGKWKGSGVFRSPTKAAGKVALREEFSRRVPCAPRKPRRYVARRIDFKAPAGKWTGTVEAQRFLRRQRLNFRVIDGRLLAPTSKKLVVSAQCGRVLTDFEIDPRDAFTALEDGRPITGRAFTMTTHASYRGGPDFTWRVRFDGRTASGWLRYTSRRCESGRVAWSAQQS